MLHFEPSLDALSLRSDVISPIKILSPDTTRALPASDAIQGSAIQGSVFMERRVLLRIETTMAALPCLQRKPTGV